MSEPRIRYEEPAPGVARVVLARPEKRNAQDKAMLYALDEAFARATRDRDVKVIVLAADGPDFSSGHDLSDQDGMEGVSPRGLAAPFDRPGAEGWYAVEREIYRELCLRWREIPKPTIAQVQGRVIAGGLMLVWPCDLIVASEDATFSDPVVAFGVNGHEYFTHVWELGARRAKELLFTGRAMSADEARQAGMVNRVVPRDELEAATLALAETIAARPSFGLELAKRAVNHSLDLQGQHNAIDAAFAMHHLAHAHNLAVHGVIVDPAGVETIRAQ
jgi:enoyl-CoA hydratase